MLAQPASASAPARTRPPAMKCLWCERVVILLLPVLTIGIETPRRGVSIRPADDARICCRFPGHSRIFAGGALVAVSGYRGRPGWDGRQGGGERPERKSVVWGEGGCRRV